MSVNSLPRGERGAGASKGRGAGLFTVIALVGSVHALFMLGLEVNRFIYTERAVAGLERDIAVLNGEAEELRAIIRHKGDVAYLEGLARQQGFVYPDEVRITTRPAPPAP